MNKHTPGPWIRVARANGKLGETVCFRGTDELTATDICRVEPEDDNGAAIKVARANAQLIAAAPDLAEALQSIVAYTDMAGARSREALELIADIARAALAKAGV